MRALILAAMLAAAAPALAQTERLPPTSRSEAFINSTNQAQALQQQLRFQNQQTQFEINQLRGDIQRARQFPPMTGPGAGAGCPRGSIGC